MKRVFLIVLGSVGIGEMGDAEQYGDKVTNTLKSASTSSSFCMPNGDTFSDIGATLLD